MTAKVYFTRDISPEKVWELYSRLGADLSGRLAIKVHSGEKGNPNFIRPAFWQPIIDRLGGTVVECNTAYPGERNETYKHKKLIEYHGWNALFNVDLMDAEGPDAELPVPDGKVTKKDIVGKNLLNYDSMLVLSHFKGHPCGGYGGALKQLSIGCASSAGKGLIHFGGVDKGTYESWDEDVQQIAFLEAMADAATAVTRKFAGKMAYINVMKNISVDCDCVANAELPCMKDIGMLASLDPVAIDRACVDLIYAAKDDPGQAHFLERLTSLSGEHTIDAAAALGVGSKEYELIEV